MKEKNNAVDAGEVASPDEAEMLGAFDEDALSDDEAIAASSDPAVSASEALSGAFSSSLAQ